MKLRKEILSYYQQYPKIHCIIEERFENINIASILAELPRPEKKNMKKLRLSASGILPRKYFIQCV